MNKLVLEQYVHPLIRSTSGIGGTGGVSARAELGDSSLFKGLWDDNLQYYNLGPELITAAAERSPEKWNKYTIGSWIPIVSENEARIIRIRSK